MVYAFIAFWVLLGLAVFFVAMRRGGPRGTQEQGTQESPRAESKLGQRAVMGVVALACVFGVVVPTLVLTSNASTGGSVTVGGVHLNAEQRQGRELFSHSCSMCHTLAAASAVGRIGPNLDIRLGSEIPTVAGRRALVLNAIAEGRARGVGQMPALLFQGHEAEAVADFVSAVAGH